MISMENVSIMVKIYKLFPEVSKMGKLFPNGLFGNNVKYSPLHRIIKKEQDKKSKSKNKTKREP